jgi:hypothetical protein
MRSKPNFQFYNQLSPRYIEPLFLQMEYDRWYKSSEMKSILRKELGIDGSEVVQRNIEAWSLAGIGDAKLVREGRSQIYLFRISPIGRQILETYSTNRDLFFDIIHFLFYSAWHRSRDVYRGRFWVYASVCDELWLNSPSKMDSFRLTAKLHSESQSSVRAAFPWLGALTPPFLEKDVSQKQLSSNRRAFCTPHLFHLATDLLYSIRSIKYGTSISMDDDTIQLISKSCLLDPNRFWEMADRTKMSIRGFEIRKGQWGTSIALEGPPTWIELPELKPISLQEYLDGGEE